MQSYIISYHKSLLPLKNLIEVAVSAINDIQDAIVAGKIPSEEATVITSPALSIVVGSISRDELAEATFGGSEDHGSFRMPSQDVLNQAMEHALGTTVNMKVTVRLQLLYVYLPLFYEMIVTIWFIL